MHIEYHKWFSPNLQQDMEIKVYGHYGKPLLVFPCAGGKFYEFEDFKMTDTVASFVNEGRIKVFTVDSLDNQTWLNHHNSPGFRAGRHNEYDRYIIKEVVPFIHSHQKSKVGIMTFGCSMGAYHAVNFLLRHPDVFDATIALSGVYTLKHFVGEYFDDNVYYNSPLDFLPNLQEDWFLQNLRRSKIAVCCGQGAWENESINDTLQLKRHFEAKGIPAWIDLWGHDVAHDWPFWRQQLPYFLSRMV